MKSPFAVSLLYLFVWSWLFVCDYSAAQQTPAFTELSGDPFSVKKRWMIGGDGNWDFIKLDSSYLKLFIAHGKTVQVVDIETGAVDGVVASFSDARAIELDNRGQFGYISDDLANTVNVLDRRSLRIVAKIPTGPGPRAVVFEPSTRLLFAVCGDPPENAPKGTVPGVNSTTSARSQAAAAASRSGRYSPTEPEPGKRRLPTDPPPESVITVIDSETWRPVASILLQGRAGFAQADDSGRVFINLVDQNAIARIDAAAIEAVIKSTIPTSQEPDAAQQIPRKPQVPLKPRGSRSIPPEDSTAALAGENPPALRFDWTNTSEATRPPEEMVEIARLGANCPRPQGMAIDSRHMRLFVACSNSQIDVVNSGTGTEITTVPTRPGTTMVDYDPNRDLIFAASGDGGGTLTVIHEHVTDSFNVVQNLPTTYRAQVLAVNPVGGEVYLVTDAGQSEHSDLRPSAFSLKLKPRPSAFHVLIVDR